MLLFQICQTVPITTRLYSTVIIFVALKVTQARLASTMVATSLRGIAGQERVAAGVV